MNEKVIISQDLLDQLAQHGKRTQELTVAFGQVEIQQLELTEFKSKLVEELKNHQQSGKQLSETLQQKYGDGNINLETGEFTPLTPVS